ncbi:DNA polymerase epsilon subunit 3-like [Tubulanus polymorphus]|uniref:DNA polymerase epsilon subunit 3-like n=1 Tax=Tubulanus polymorphus TaxID=672921 RepID=UPI003DA54D0F
MAEKPEDLNLPNTVVTRIIKEALPDGVNVSKDARLAMSKAASVFVLYATSCANNHAMKGKRKTISAQDVLTAMKDMEFEKFIDPLKSSLEAFKNEQKSKKVATAEKKKKAVQEEEEEAATEENGGHDEMETEEQEDETAAAAEEDDDDDDDDDNEED